MKRQHEETCTWIEISDYPGRFMVSEDGRIKSLSRIVNRRNGSHHVTKEIIKAQRINKFGYCTIYLSIDKNYRHLFVHRIVAEHFISKRPSDKHFVNHKDGNKQNNHYTNLEWVTVSENHKHAYRMGLMSQKGENHASNKLNNKQVMQIFNSKSTHSQLSKKFKVSQATIGNIKTGATWSHITGKKYQKVKPLKNAA